MSETITFSSEPCAAYRHNRVSFSGITIWRVAKGGDAMNAYRE
jgi:hypothetical protein